MERAQIIEAAISGDVQAAQKILTDAAGKPASADLNSALFCAVEHMHPEIMRLLLSHGADVNVKDEFGQTPLHLALDTEAEHSKYLYDVEGIIAPPTTELSEILLNHGADVNAETEKGETPLDWAVASNHEAGVKMLRERGANKRAT